MLSVPGCYYTAGIPRDSLTLKKNFIRKNRKGARARLRRFARPDEDAEFGISMRRRFERVVESARPLKIETSPSGGARHPRPRRSRAARQRLAEVDGF